MLDTLLIDPVTKAHLVRSRALIESARRERQQLLRQIEKSEKTIARSRELITRLDEMLARLASRPRQLVLVIFVGVSKKISRRVNYVTSPHVNKPNVKEDIITTNGRVGSGSCLY